MVKSCIAKKMAKNPSRPSPLVLNLLMVSLLLVLPAVISCSACGGEAWLERFDSVCPICGSSQVQLTGGTEELRLIALDVD